MADKPNAEMTVPELLEARTKIRERLGAGTGGVDFFGITRPNVSAQEELLSILQEIETELAERGHKDA